MAHKLIVPQKRVNIISSAAVAGHEEQKGPLGDCFDLTDTGDDRFGKKTWEQSESEMQRLAVGCVMKKSGFVEGEVDALYAGDLLNQCVGSNYGLAEYNIPYFGLYGACSTASEGILLSSLMCSAVDARCIAVTSSHYCSAERQFRYPLEYGGQRTPTSQWTVTGSGAFLLSSREEDESLFSEDEYIPTVADVLPGYVIDKGISDVNNMGAAMAPAAADTIRRYFELGNRPDEFDMIITGDLGKEGSKILVDLLYSSGHDVSANHVDCGMMIYNIDEADKHAGGSGCGCSAVVMAGHILRKIRQGVLSNIIFIGTGALMSPVVLNQGSTIPGIGHLVHIVGRKRGE